MEKKSIEKIFIETDYAEKKFKEIVVKNDGNYMTIFLNGKWGSGKTSFLKRCESKFKKDGWKLKYLKVWEIKDDRSLIKIAFKELHPVTYRIVSVIIITSIVTAILGTPTFNLGLEKYYILFLNLFGTPLRATEAMKSFLMLFGLFALVFQFIKARSDSSYVNLLHLYNRFETRQVLIIDDFDRISNDRQLEAYKLFNILHGEIPIVFVGDWEKIVSSQTITSQYLSKFVDRKCELPVSLSSFEVSKLYSEKILDTYGGISGTEPEQFKNFLNEVFISNNYSLRDIDHFIELLNYELGYKYGSVQVHQFIAILYLSLFEEGLYNQLIKNYQVENNVTFFNEISVNEISVNEISVNESKYIKQKFIEELLFNSYKDEFPQCFSDNPISYFLDDNITNLSDKEADSIYTNLLDNPNSYLSKTNKESEFLLYLKNKVIEKSDQDKIVRIILKTIDKDGYFELNKVLYTCVTYSVGLKNGPIDTFKQRTFDFWEEKLKDYSVGKKCHIYRKINVFSHFYDNLKEQAKVYIDSCIQNANKTIDYPADVAYFLVEGDYRNVKESEVDLKKIYEKMNEKDILEFLKYLEIYRQGYILTAFNSSGETIPLLDILDPILEKFVNLERILYFPKPKS